MLSSLLRPKKSRRARGQFNSSSPYSHRSQEREPEPVRHAAADWTETENDDDESEEEDEGEHEEERMHEGEEGEGDEDGGSATPLLPIFSAAHLDSLPVYSLTHAIRLIILPRCETTLTWDQLRSPQVSQFLIKPMQQQIRTTHFSRATLYALMANCLQFGKEGYTNPGNAGTSRTRAMVCELLALKLLKEYNTRELIDALSYDFYPLQGLAAGQPLNAVEQKNRPKLVAARTSTLEVAIRAQAKKFLAHPSVVQQLEAIWAGTIVFHSTADHLHRIPPQVKTQRSGANERSPLLRSSPDKALQGNPQPVSLSPRRTVTLYDPRDASLFKLSRLRVPRYRQFFSTMSLAILLALFLAVLTRRSSKITNLEVVFWLWSAGFMLDEIVGFNEQGFSLYLMSFWNTFDVGILLLLVIYYCMRLYGLFLFGTARHQWDNMSYDVLAANAVLLFPRLFNVLDHYRYFSQLLIAFRLMAVDLAAVFVLILISCSGFFVAFTLSFGEDYDPAKVAYSLFQIILGFTPAAWAVWDDYNILGKAVLTLFLFICHFLIVTILITVLTNSFMAIVSNANEEHQFVFAVNTISMVKNDALFSYVAPSNLLAWILTPLRYVISFRSFVKLNRYVIKATHFPLLFSIFAYEKMFLARTVYEPTDLVEHHGRGRNRMVSFLDPTSRNALFSPAVLTRHESMAGMQKDRALDEVFRLAPKGSLRNTMKSQERRKTSNVVNSWMDQNEGIASSPPEQDRSIVDRLESDRIASRRLTGASSEDHRGVSGCRSVVSDPADLMSTIGGLDAGRFQRRSDPDFTTSVSGAPPVTQVDGAETEADHLGGYDATDASQLIENAYNLNPKQLRREDDDEEDYFRTPKASRSQPHQFSTSFRKDTSPKATSPQLSPPKNKSVRRTHNRNMSTNTILYNPIASFQAAQQSTSTSSPKPTRFIPSKAATGANTPVKRTIYGTSKPRPILATRNTFQTFPSRPMPRRRASLELGSDLGFDTHANQDMLGAVPSSFATQMAMAMAPRQQQQAENDAMMGRLMLARMKTLEEGFAEVVREFRGSRAGSRIGSVDGEEKDKVVRRREERGNQRKSGGGRVSRPGTAGGSRKDENDDDGDREADDEGREKEKEKEKESKRSGDTPEQRILRAHIKRGLSA